MPSVLDGFARPGKASLTQPRAMFDRKYNAYPRFPLNAEFSFLNAECTYPYTCRAIDFNGCAVKCSKSKGDRFKPRFFLEVKNYSRLIIGDR